MFLNAHDFDLVLGMEWVGVMESVSTGVLLRADLTGLFAVAMVRTCRLTARSKTANFGSTSLIMQRCQTPQELHLII